MLITLRFKEVLYIFLSFPLAQFWGVPQRRRRIYLVADFAGFSAPTLLFEQDRLFGDTAQGEGEGQGASAPAQGSAGGAGGTCLTPWDAQSKRIHDEDGTWPSLYSSDGGGRGYVNSRAFAANQRDEVRDLHGISGAIQAQPGMKQQTFVAQHLPEDVFAFHINQREETIDLNGVSGALLATSNMQMQTFIMPETGCLNPWDTQQSRISTPDGIAPTMAGADGGGGRNPAGLIMAAGFCAGAAPAAGGIGYQEECAPTLKAAESGTNMVPSILCLNDQGGERMDVLEGLTGTLRAQMAGHPPLVLATQQGGAELGVDICPTITASAGMSGNNQPVLFENHAQNSRCNGPLEIAPTITQMYGTGGNSLPLVTQEAEAFCIAGNIIDRQPQNGGNGKGYQPDLAYTITATDKHAVYQRTIGALCRGDEKGIGNQYVAQDKCIIQPDNKPAEIGAKLIRRLTPLECERLQGFSDFWTDIPGASDSARYKALGNSVAIPCVDHVLRGVAYFLEEEGDDDA